MVGTTPSRIRAFFRKFRGLGLISVNSRGRLSVREERISDCVARSAFAAGIEADHDRRQSSGAYERFGAPAARSQAAAAAACNLQGASW